MNVPTTMNTTHNVTVTVRSSHRGWSTAAAYSGFPE